MKAGEIFRNDQGEYSFMCFHCGFTFQDFAETINHINTHFESNDIKLEIDAQTPEFVVCAESEPDVSHGQWLSSNKATTMECETSNVQSHSEAQVRRGRKRKEVIDTPQQYPCAQSELDVTHSDKLSLSKSTTLEAEISNVPVQIEVRRRGRKRKQIVDTMQSCPLAESDLVVTLKRTSESKSLNLPVHPEVLASRIKRRPMLDIPQHCPLCQLWCDDFRDHLKTEHQITDRIYQCFICGVFCKNYMTLKNHISCIKHTNYKCYHCEMEPPVTKPSDPRRHKCLYCKEWFPNHIEFKIHFKDAHNKDADYFFHKRSNCNIFTCYVCEREFPLRYYLVAHMRTHHEKFLRHQCPTCGRRLRTFGQLTQHLKTHEGKTFTCDQCNKAFPYYAKLRNHMGCHKTELNFKCNICSKAFKLRKYLKRHMAVHNNVKKYVCRFCGACFNFTSGRRAHEKSQHKAI